MVLGRGRKVDGAEAFAFAGAAIHPYQVIVTTGQPAVVL